MSIYSLILNEKFLHSFVWHIPSIVSASVHRVWRRRSSVQHSPESTWLFLFNGCWLFKRGKGRLRWRRRGVHRSGQVMSHFRAWRANRGPLSAVLSPAAAAWRGTGASAGRGLNWALCSPPALFRSEASHTAGPCRPRDSCSGCCWHTPRHFGSAGARCRTPGLWWKQCKDKREQWESSRWQDILDNTLLEAYCRASKAYCKSASCKIREKISCSQLLRRRWKSLTKSFLQVKCYHILLPI